MCSRLALLLAVAALSVHSMTASAAEEDAPDYARPGFYIGVGVSGASYTEIANFVEDELRGVGVPVNVDTDTGVGFDLYGGYRAHPNIAVEAEFEMIPATDLKLSGFGRVLRSRPGRSPATSRSFRSRARRSRSCSSVSVFFMAS